LQLKVQRPRHHSRAFSQQLIIGAAVKEILRGPDYVVSSEKGLRLVEVKFRKISEHGGQPGVYLKNSDLNRYRKYWDESLIALIRPYGERFFCQEVRELVLEPWRRDGSIMDSLTKIRPILETVTNRGSELSA
jgi:hypothetical protein